MNVLNLPPRVMTYAGLIDKWSQMFGLDPFLVAAIGDRETAWGTAKDCDVQGPGCTGDFGRRNPARWGYALPPDGKGWGRGLMQVDYGGHLDFCVQNLPDGLPRWAHADDNIQQGCLILHSAMRALTNVSGAHLTAAATCAYNAGTGNAFKALGQCAGTDKDPLKALDAVTTGGDYVTWCLNRRDLFAGFCGPR